MTSTARQDQIRAAQRDSNNVMLGYALSGDNKQLQVKRTAGWIGEKVDELKQAISDGTVLRCRHITGPQPIFANAWTPGRIVCLNCLDTIAATGIANHTCDRCHKVARPLLATMAQLGLLIFNFGLCKPCADIEGVEGASRP